MKKLSFILLFVCIVLSGGFLVLNRYIYDQKQENNPSFAPYQGTLSGVIVCLPHADQSGPQTMECAYGLTTDSGESYALDLSLNSQEAPMLTVGERFSATGLITPIENLSSDHWKKYAIDGIFSVTSK